MYKISASQESRPDMLKKMGMAEAERDDTLAVIEILLKNKMGINTLLTAGGYDEWHIFIWVRCVHAHGTKSHFAQQAAKKAVAKCVSRTSLRTNEEKDQASVGCGWCGRLPT